MSFLSNSDLNEFLEHHYVKDELKTLSYGTTGYRLKAEYLNGISIRIAILGMIKSIFEKAAIGLMITASHNPDTDNGIKVIEYNGDMIPKKWESLAVDLVQCNAKDVLSLMAKKCEELGITLDDREKAILLIGHDTRTSSPKLCDLIKQTLNFFQCKYIVFENVTTPQLHYYVRQYNFKKLIDKNMLIEDYFSRFSNAFIYKKINRNSNKSILNIDCANGVGSLHLKEIQKRVGQFLDIKLFNTSIVNNLNHNCGADHVKIKQNIPVIYNSSIEYSDLQIRSGDKWCSIDGDADRLIYYYLNPTTQSFCMLDGDKIAVLIASYLVKLLDNLLEVKEAVTIANIQTAYANSASTKYIENDLKIPTVCVPTGVKHLHEAAKKYDIGIYFEANGHGTVLFSDKFRQLIETTTIKNENIDELKRILNLINEADGDAITDMLIIEHILFQNQSYDHEIDKLINWYNMYHDYPSRQLKVPVTDRSCFTTTNAERNLITPDGLQAEIDELVKENILKNNYARCFVRPSGTEDIVRVYAESTSQSQADELANQVAKLLSKF